MWKDIPFPHPVWYLFNRVFVGGLKETLYLTAHSHCVSRVSRYILNVMEFKDLMAYFEKIRPILNVSPIIALATLVSDSLTH